MAPPVIVMGAGGHARVLLDALRDTGRQVLGLTTSRPEQVGADIGGVRVLGSDEVISSYKPHEAELVNGVGSVRVDSRRRQIYEVFKKRGYTFASVIHPTVILGSRVQLHEGVQLMAGVIVQTGSVIGENTIINTGAVIDHDALIGDHVHIAPRCALSGSVRVGHDSHIGTGAVIIQGIHIGNEVLVAAGAVVTTAVEAGMRVGGIPARALR
jgi:sugar O-acyltransferase (sialic acid O-acetyltransferase NeuD family)